MRVGKDGFGYDAATDTYQDLIKAGVIDPTKVVRTALQNSASVAGLMLTTGRPSRLDRRSTLSTRNDVVVDVPGVVVGEWWRGQRGPVANLLDPYRVRVDFVDEGVAKRAGEAQRSGQRTAHSVCVALHERERQATSLLEDPRHRP